MIITDPTLKPSDRLIQSVREYFENKGYSFQKSQKTFVKPFGRGYQFVSFWFKISTLTSVSLQWSIQFEKLEKLLAELNGYPKRYKSQRTLATNMPNYTRWLENVEQTFPLYDESTLAYDDFSINQAANNIIKGYETYVISYFEEFKDYQAIENYFNQYEFKNITGIILSKYVEDPEFDILTQTLWEQIRRRNADLNSEEDIIFKKTMEVLNKRNLKELLD